MNPHAPDWKPRLPLKLHDLEYNISFIVDADNKTVSKQFLIDAYQAALAPVEMLLFCPRCDAQHIDKPIPGWDNPPHATHLCARCGLLWRPSNRNTVGVASVPVTHSKHATSIRAAFPVETIVSLSGSAPRLYGGREALGPCGLVVHFDPDLPGDVMEFRDFVTGRLLARIINVGQA